MIAVCWQSSAKYCMHKNKTNFCFIVGVSASAIKSQSKSICPMRTKHNYISLLLLILYEIHVM